MAFLCLILRTCGHQRIHLRVSRELIRKRQKHFVITDKPFALTAVCDELHLLLRDMELFCENVTISGCLIQHIDDVAVTDEFLDSAEFKLIEPKTEDVPEKGDNFTITDDSLGEGGAKAKFRANQLSKCRCSTDFLPS